MPQTACYVHSRNDNGTWNVENVPVFMTHGRGGREVDTDELDTIISNTNNSDRIKGSPKLVIDHPGFEGSPVIGRARNLRRVQEVVFADFKDIRAKAFREILMGAFPQWSVGLDYQTLSMIEHVAMLGSIESYFPFSAIECDLSAAEEKQLKKDIEEDVSFTFARGKRGEYQHYQMFKGSKQMPKLFTKDKDGNLVKVEGQLFKEDGSKFMLEPEDAGQIVEIVQEQVAPIKEGLAMLQVKVDAMGTGTEEPDATKEKETPKEAEPEKEPKPEAKNEKTDDDEEKEGKDNKKGKGYEDDEEKPKDKEDDEEKKKSKKNSSKDSPDLDALEAQIKAEAKAATLESEAYKREISDKVKEVIDPKRYANADQLIKSHTETIFRMPDEESQQAALDIVLNAYKDGASFSKRLPSTTEKTKDKEGDKGEFSQVAVAFLENVKKTGKKDFAGRFKVSEPEEFAKYLEENPDHFERIKASVSA